MVPLQDVHLYMWPSKYITESIPYIRRGLDEEESVHPSQQKIADNLHSGHSMLFSNFNAVTGSQTITCESMQLNSLEHGGGIIL